MAWSDDLFARFPNAAILREAPLNRYTSFRIGGPAEALWEISSQQELSNALAYCREKQVPFAVLGNGSNTLAPDEGLRALVLHIGSQYSRIQVSGTEIWAQSGALLPALSKVAAQNSLSGLEFASGIPGSIGGAIRMNAGAYGGQMADVVAVVRVLSSRGEEEEISGNAMRFGYRHSLLCEQPLYVSEVCFRLTLEDRAKIEERMAEYTAKRKSKQPLQYPSAGSVFKRPANGYAGQLVEQAGCKGLSIGGAQVSEMHANFIINTGAATAGDVLALIAMVQKRVLENSGVWLETEVCPLSVSTAGIGCNSFVS